MKTGKNDRTVIAVFTICAGVICAAFGLSDFWEAARLNIRVVQPLLGCVMIFCGVGQLIQYSNQRLLRKVCDFNKQVIEKSETK